MFNLSSYLEKFKNLKDPREDKVTIARIIGEEIGVVITEKDITIQKGKVFLQGSALYKNRVFISKEGILKKIYEALPDLHIKEVV